MLAVVFKDVITLWDPDYNTMHHDVISLGSSEVTIRCDCSFVHFMILF